MIVAAFALFAAVSCDKDNGYDATKDYEDMFKEEGKDEPTPPAPPVPEDESWFKMKGVVCSWSDVNDRSVIDYIKIARDSGLNCFSIYNAPRNTELWDRFAKECADSGIDLEFEEHMLSYLLPRNLFDEHPEYFRMNKGGVRINDVNGCPSSQAALEVMKTRAKDIARNYKSTNNRYYCWLDDGGDVCYCDKCKDLSASDQALIFENAILEGLKSVNPDAMLAHLAYYNTVDAPKNVEPAEGIFLEFAPIGRDRYHALTDTWAKGSDGRTHAEYIRALYDNLQLFPVETAQVLEYWLDDSLYSGWDPWNLKPVFWDHTLFFLDIQKYASFGIRNITCYTAYVGPAYVKKFEDIEFLYDYGRTLTKFKP